MMRLNGLYRLAAAFVVSLFLAACGSGNHADPMLGDSVDIVAETSGGIPTGKAYFTLGFVKDLQDRRFVNVVVDLNGDGAWAAYPAGQAGQAEWVAQNMSAHVAPTEQYSFVFDIVDVSALSRRDFKARVIVTDRPIGVQSEAAGWDGGVPADRLASADFTVGRVRTFEVDDVMTPDPDGLGSTGAALAAAFPLHALLFDMFPKAIAATPVPSRLKDATITDSVYHAGVPHISQGHNECIPTSAATSLLWLANKYNFRDRMPASQADLIAELKTAFKWTRRSGVFVAKTKESPTGEGYLEGMGKFVRDRGLPIEVHQFGGRFDDNIFPQIVAELKKGQDVNLDLEYQNPATGNRVAGHGVTVVGGWATSTGTTYLDIRDPASAGTGVSSYLVEGSNLVGFRRPLRVFIRFAFAESPSSAAGTPPPVVNPPPPPAPPPPGPSVVVNPSSLAVVHIMGTTPCPTPVGSFFVGESAVGAVSWTITDIPVWLTLSRTSGTLNTTADVQEVSVAFNCNVQSKGSYTAVLKVTGKDGAGNETGTVNVTVSVNVT